MANFKVKENVDLITNSNVEIKNLLPVSGHIIPFAGTTAPSGWAICDGTNGTPDLRGRFLVGARSSANIGSDYGSTTHTHSYSFGSLDFGNATDSHQAVDTGFADPTDYSGHSHNTSMGFGSGSGANNLLANSGNAGGPIAFVNRPHSHNGSGSIGYNASNHNTHLHYDGGASEASRVLSHDTAHSLTSTPSGNMDSASSYQPFIIMNYIMKL